MTPKHTCVMGPIYIKHNDLLHINGDVALELCTADERVEPDSIVGAQKLRNVWSLLTKCDKSRKPILKNGFYSRKNDYVA